MKLVELYGRVRYAVRIEGISRREAARRFGIDPRTVAKMLTFSVPPGYRRNGSPARPKLDAFVGIFDRILEEDKGKPRRRRGMHVHFGRRAGPQPRELVAAHPRRNAYTAKTGRCNRYVR